MEGTFKPESNMQHLIMIMKITVFVNEPIIVLFEIMALNPIKRSVKLMICPMVVRKIYWPFAVLVLNSLVLDIMAVNPGRFFFAFLVMPAVCPGRAPKNKNQGQHRYSNFYYLSFHWSVSLISGFYNFRRRCLLDG